MRSAASHNGHVARSLPPTGRAPASPSSAELGAFGSPSDIAIVVPPLPPSGIIQLLSHRRRYEAFGSHWLDATSPLIIGSGVASMGQLPTLGASAAVIAQPVNDHARGRRRYAIEKRAVDIVMAAIALMALTPLFLMVAILIKSTSRGTVFYSQTRCGRDGKPFSCHKFRTMVEDAHERKAEIVGLNEASGPVFKIKNDPRITPLGRWLRKSSIDELPQLLNVIRGEMSIVGPRPPLPEEVELYTSRQLERLAVTPGLTCLWQTAGRSSIGFDEWVELDLEYIRRRSGWFDFWLVVRTVPAVLLARGAC